METNNHYFYVVECKDGTYYAGYTNNLAKTHFSTIMKEKGQNIRGQEGLFS